MPTIDQSRNTGDASRRPTREQCIADAARVYSTALSQGLTRRPDEALEERAA